MRVEKFEEEGGCAYWGDEGVEGGLAKNKGSVEKFLQKPLSCKLYPPPEKTLREKCIVLFHLLFLFK